MNLLGVEIARPPLPGLYWVPGPSGFLTSALVDIAVFFGGEQRLLWVDAANRFNAHAVGIAARTAGKDPRQILRSFWVARPFTAFQLERLVGEKLLSAARYFGTRLAVIADPASLYREAAAQHYPIVRSAARFQEDLCVLSKQLAIMVLDPHVGETARLGLDLGPRPDRKGR